MGLYAGQATRASGRMAGSVWNRPARVKVYLKCFSGAFPMANTLNPISWSFS